MKTPIRIPILQTLREYDTRKAVSDLKSALNVALLDFPQGMAYAMIAGLPYFMGIYASAVAAFLGPVFASSRHIMLGPTNAIAVMCLSTFLGLGLNQEQAIIVMPLLLLMVSAFMIIGSMLKLANLVNYVSRTVITGYITAAAFLIIIKQIKYVFGIEVLSTSTFAAALHQTLLHLHEIDLNSTLVAASTILIFLLFKRLTPKIPAVASSLAIMYGVSLIFEHYSVDIVTLGSSLDSTPAWKLTLPSISLDLIGKLAPGAFAISFLSLLESSSITKTLASQSGDTVDTNQQMMSMGIANLGCSLFGGMPISGSLTRSTLNYKSGAKTPVSSMFSALILASAFLLLAPHVGKIPQASLAALVIMVGVSLFNRKNIRFALGTTRQDLIVFALTFGTGLIFPLNTSIFIGVIASMLLFIQKAGRPDLVEYSLGSNGLTNTPYKKNRGQIALLHVEGDLFFASSDLFLNQARNLSQNKCLKVIVLRLRNAHNLDATCAMALEQFVQYTKEKKRNLIITGAHREVYEILDKSGLLELIGKANVFKDDPNNPTLSTSLALKRATQLVGDELELKLFVSDKSS
ncbi:MAG: SulP family inorganic anion transporter [Opitutales bacterium]|nr:SulP family inorganic anion transporter [Opitutales bacterium]